MEDRESSKEWSHGPTDSDLRWNHPLRTDCCIHWVVSELKLHSITHQCIVNYHLHKTYSAGIFKISRYAVNLCPISAVEYRIRSSQSTCYHLQYLLREVTTVDSIQQYSGFLSVSSVQRTATDDYLHSS